MNRSNQPNRTLRTIKNSHTKATNNNTKNHQKPPLVNKSNLSKPSANASSSSSSSASSSSSSSSSVSASVGSSSKAPVTNQNKNKINTTTEALLVFDDSDAETEDEKTDSKNTKNTKNTEVVSDKSKFSSGIQLKPVTIKPLSKVNSGSGASSSTGADVSSSANANSSTNSNANSSTSTKASAPVLDKKAMEAIYAQSIDLIYECDPDQNCSKEELIERLERKRDRLPENHPDIIAFNHLLKELLVEDREQKITNMNQIRNQQDLIVTKVKLKKEHFVGKTNLTPSEEEYKELGEDEQLKIFKTSKKFFEKVREYKTIPKNMADPFAKGKLRGNRKPPPELFNSIAAKFM